MALFAPWIATHDYDELSANLLADPFSKENLLGTDARGRDIFSRIVFGARVSIWVGLGAVITSTLLAYVIGTISGYFGGPTDLVIQRFVDAWMSIPSLVILLTVIRLMEPSMLTVAVAIGVVLAGGSSRIARSAVLGVKGFTYIEAARTIGASDLRIMLRHVLPNIVHVMLITLSVQLGVAILLESSLSFLGYGVPPPAPSWGGMLSGQARTYMLQQPWLSIWPGVAIFLTVYAFNMLGDALRDVFDPRLRGIGGRTRI
jgi:peptide/nickel transport system permease protein